MQDFRLGQTETFLALSLRARVDVQLMPKRKSSTLCICGRKGGVGKSTVAVTLAAIWAEKNPVLLVDLDPQGSASTSLGVPLNVSGAAEALLGAPVKPVPLEAMPRLGLWVGTPMLERVATEVDPGSLKRALVRVRKSQKKLRVVIDTPPGLRLLELAALGVADSVLVVTTSELLALATVGRAVAGLDGMRTALVANKLLKRELETLPDTLRASTRLPVMPVRQDAPACKRALRLAQPATLAAPDSRIAEDLREVAKWL